MNEMQELIQEILTGMQRRYRGMSEIERLTKELADTLSSGERESAQLLLNMRQSEMEKVGDVDHALREMLHVLEPEKREYIAGLMNGNEQSGYDSPEEEKIVRMAEQTSRILERIIVVDKILSQKLAGKDSYYR